MVEDEDSKITQKNRIIVVTGPTATGKTRRAVDIARHYGGEIISADSRQVYRGMDLGTGKDLDEYGDIPYHLIDVCEAGEKYNLHKYLRDFRIALQDIEGRNKQVVICGGTGMYLENALGGVVLPDVPENKELREELSHFSLPELAEILKKYKRLHNTTDIDTVKRAVRAIEIEDFYERHPESAKETKREWVKPLDSLIIGIDISRDSRRERISGRLKKRLDDGMVDEVRNLLHIGIPAEDLIYYGLEYKYLTLFVTGKLDYDQMVKELEIAIHQFAKRQMTWLRGMERRGFKIHWLPFDMDSNDFLEEVENLLLIG